MIQIYAYLNNTKELIFIRVNLTQVKLTTVVRIRNNDITIRVLYIIMGLNAVNAVKIFKIFPKLLILNTKKEPYKNRKFRCTLAKEYSPSPKINKINQAEMGSKWYN